jgi:2-hydroxy fatty acid dioxygenase
LEEPWLTIPSTQFTNSGTLIKLPESMTIPHLELNAGTLLCLSYCGLYILLEPVAGGAYSVLLLASTALGHYLVSTYGMITNYWAAGGFVVGWVAQIFSHHEFEGRAPALLDNLFQALFLAPLFVWLETLFALGYRPELKERVEKMALEDIKKYREEKALKANGKVNGGANGHAKNA